MDLEEPMSHANGASETLRERAGVASDDPEMLSDAKTPKEDVPISSIEQSNTVDSLQDTENTVGGAVMVEIQVPAPTRPWEYTKVEEDDVVDTVLQEIRPRGSHVRYRVVFADGREDIVTAETLLELSNGVNALDFYNNRSEAEDLSNGQGHSSQTRSIGTLRMSGLGKRARKAPYRLEDDSESEDDLNDVDELSVDPRQPKRGRVLLRMSTGDERRTGGRIISLLDSDEDEELADNGSDPGRARHIRLTRRGQPSERLTRSSDMHSRPSINYQEAMDIDDFHDEDHVEGDEFDEESDNEILYHTSRSRRSTGRTRPTGGGKLSQRGFARSSNGQTPEMKEGSRRSGRATKSTKFMKDVLEDDDMFAEYVEESSIPKVVTIRETFKPVSSQSVFAVIHNGNCDSCGGFGTASNKGSSPLIYCQGCSTSIHKSCLGPRSARDHIVTKVGEDDFVMQCRRCVGTAKRKDPTAARLDMCQGCKSPGKACAPFSSKKTPKQEEKLREENGGSDPITTVDPDLVNNGASVLFRCISCRRGFHFEHLPPLSESSNRDASAEDRRDERFAEYSQSWQCKECLEAPGKVQTLVAWKPANIDSYVPGTTVDQLNEDEKEYLVKWENKSYFRCTWMPGAWIWGMTVASTRNKLARDESNNNALPKMSEKDAIPEEYLRIEIVLDVKYSSRVSTHTEEVDKARVREVREAFVKLQGLGYDEVVWEQPPDPSETERWMDFVDAYNEYIAGKYFKQQAPRAKERLEEYRSLNFERQVLLAEQPKAMTGGTMMPYQMEGLHWLLYNFHQQKNVILADEMGLGKTIQVIATLATLIKEKPKCWPFLVVVPNSTCPNWRREIKKWAPSVRVVAYYGLRQARDMTMKYELYPDGRSDLRAHIVVTSYEAPVDDHSRSFFQKVKWAGLVVDEGQRLKNDKNLLYGALDSLKIPFRVLLTGTPLQNNKRELFNLLQFLDRNVDASELDEKYSELTNENLSELHDLIRPYFLRRTKAQVLKFLPPMAQVIIPVTMSVVQKKLSKSILSKSPDLLKSIFVKDQSQLRPSERGSLNNILMQLRKCLCHPFIYSDAIEERSASPAVLHRNLVDASSKLQLLEIMLPKLQERGHRVLIFSQFLKQLDIVEDFLDGLGFPFQRLDGNVGTLEKQRRIDAFNAPDSPLFAFLLSTRAGGVGINLATADTVIIMDPDFNPHQDIQALSRAHRLGQKKKVLVFQLMTKDSAEEKIVQIGRKKMALDHALIESMGADDDAGLDLQSILRHGAQALFEDDNQNDIHYDSASVDKLLDRTQVEDTSAGDDKSAESQFSYARIWANKSGALTDDVGDPDTDTANNPTVWDKILKQREADAAAEKAAQQTQLGRGKRVQRVDYQKSNFGTEDDAIFTSPAKRASSPASDTDFADHASEVEDEDEESEVLDDEEGSHKKGTKSPKASPKARNDKGMPRSNVSARRNSATPKRAVATRQSPRKHTTSARSTPAKRVTSKTNDRVPKQEARSKTSPAKKASTKSNGRVPQQADRSQKSTGVRKTAARSSDAKPKTSASVSTKKSPRGKSVAPLSSVSKPKAEAHMVVKSDAADTAGAKVVTSDSEPMERANDQTLSNPEPQQLMTSEESKSPNQSSSNHNPMEQSMDTTLRRTTPPSKSEGAMPVETFTTQDTAI